MRRTLLALLLVAAVLPIGSASARTVPANWNETFMWRGKPIATFKVGKLTFLKSGWGATASITNRSDRPLRLVKKRFELRVYKTRAYGPRAKYEWLAATSIDPPMPTTLPPGATWNGGFGGKALPRRGEYVRVAFGRYARAGGMRSSWWWVTDHTFRY